MKIGLDYGGVVSFDPVGWHEVAAKVIWAGHEVFILSHAHGGEDTERRRIFAQMLGATDLTFDDLDPYDEDGIRQRKTELARRYSIELMIEDDMGRCAAMKKGNPDCIFVCIPQSRWSFGKDFLRLFSELVDA